MILAVVVHPVALGMAALAVAGGLWYAGHHQMRTATYDMVFGNFLPPSITSFSMTTTLHR